MELLEEMDPELQIPDGFHPLKTQVAGHTFADSAEAIGMLQDASAGYVLKPMGKPSCGERELKFYETLQSSEDPILKRALTLVPKFHQKLTLVVRHREHTFLKLEDLSYGMRKPCIMDIKIGKRTWDPMASPQKRSVEEQKYVRCKQVLGLCIPGFQVYTRTPSSGDGGVLLRYGKEYGKQLDAAGFRNTIVMFLNAHNNVYQPFLHEMLRQLYAIREWFSEQRIFHFYASSLLIAYDFEVLQMHLKSNGQQQLANGNDLVAEEEKVGSPPPGENVDINECQRLPSVAQHIKVRMIDFAHVFPAKDASQDTNYMFGLQNLIYVIEDLVDR